MKGESMALAAALPSLQEEEHRSKEFKRRRSRGAHLAAAA